jgi:hypothetical protein
MKNFINNFPEATVFLNWHFVLSAFGTPVLKHVGDAAEILRQLKLLI